MKKFLYSCILMILGVPLLFAPPVEIPVVKKSVKEKSLEWTQFPVGLYWVTKESMPEIRNLGFNYVIPIPDEMVPISDPKGRFEAVAMDYLDCALENGLKCAFFIDKIDLERYAAGTLSWEKIADAIRLISSHPAFLLYYFRDEPENEGAARISDPEFLKEFSRKIKTVDPVHPTFLVNFLPQVYEKYAQIPDIYSIDVYPIPHKPVTAVSEAVDLAFKANDWKTPIWFTVQGFGNTSLVKRSPTPEELRCMTYLSIVHGVSGIQFFRYCGERWRALQPKILWDEIVKVVGELNQLSPVLKEGIDLDSSQVTVPDGIDLSIKLYDGDLYLLAVNKEEHSIEAEFGFSFFPGRVEVQFENRMIESGENNFVDTFGPLDVHVYRLENHFFIDSGIRGDLVEVDCPVNLKVYQNLPGVESVDFFVNDHIAGNPVQTAYGWEVQWIPEMWGVQRVKAISVTGERIVSATLELSAHYSTRKNVWHSYDIRMKESMAAGAVEDSDGLAASVEFYEALRNDIGSGRQFSRYNSELHPYEWNQVENYWSPDGKKGYPYVGKKISRRHINRGNSNLSLPISVRDLAVHPPCGSRFTVSSFVVPEGGIYSVLGVGVRKSTGCGNPVVLELFSPWGESVITLTSEGTEWITDSMRYDFGFLEADSRIYFAVGSGRDCSCDFAEIRWTIAREET